MAVVTNITHEHLDYHKTYENYRAAKGQLFASLGTAAVKASGPAKAAVLNADDSSASYLESLLAPLPAVRPIRYSASPALNEPRRRRLGRPGGLHTSRNRVPRSWARFLHPGAVAAGGRVQRLQLSGGGGRHRRGAWPGAGGDSTRHRGAWRRSRPHGTHRPGPAIHRHGRFCAHPQCAPARARNRPPVAGAWPPGAA